MIKDLIVNEVVDPYAKAVGVNGKRGMVIDLNSTNPEGWEEDRKPELKAPTDSIIYEAHVRDLTIDETSGIKDEFKGKIAYFAGINNAKFRRKVVPGDTLRLEVELTKIRGKAGVGYGIAYVEDKKVCEGELTFMVG